MSVLRSLKDSFDQQVYLGGRFMSLRDAVLLGKQSGATHVGVETHSLTHAGLFDFDKPGDNDVGGCTQFVSVESLLEGKVPWIGRDEVIKTQGTDRCPA